MSNWIHTVARKPTRDDGNEKGLVWVRWADNGVGVRSWNAMNTAVTEAVAWMAIPKYDPLPPPPDGYELLTDYNAEPDDQALLLSVDRIWRIRDYRGRYNKRDVYCVPCKPARVPSIITSGLLASGTWLAIDDDEEAFLYSHKPAWKGSYWEYEDGECYTFVLDEDSPICGEKAIWHVP